MNFATNDQPYLDDTFFMVSLINHNRLYTFLDIKKLIYKKLVLDGQIAKKLSVFKPQRLKETCFFIFLL